MIDIHSHVLPGIDDGAEDLETAVRMCRMAAADGCEAVIATPHQRHPAWDNSDRRKLEILRERVQSRLGGAPAIYLGAEVRVDSQLLADLEPGAAAEVTPLAGSRYLLVEFSRQAVPEPAEELVHELVVGGRVPILAHPEFVRFLASDPGLMARLAEMGALFQVTAMSLTGDFGLAVQRRVRSMLDRGLVHFVASDCHSDTWRPPGLARARGLIEREWGAAAAFALTTGHPSAVLRDRPLGRELEELSTSGARPAG